MSSEFRNPQNFPPRPGEAEVERVGLATVLLRVNLEGARVAPGEVFGDGDGFVPRAAVLDDDLEVGIRLIHEALEGFGQELALVEGGDHNGNKRRGGHGKIEVAVEPAQAVGCVVSIRR